MKLIKAYANWCLPCKQLGTLLEGIDLGDIELVNLNVEDEPDKATSLGVRALPTMFIVDKEGKVLDTKVGGWPSASTLQTWVDSYKHHG
jgi:thioredoxin-like negative regulator of GroEL